MSATNRGAIRNKDDYYATPAWAINQFLDSFFTDYNLPSVARILDPCAGGDVERGMAYPAGLEQAGWRNIETMDIRGDSPAMMHGVDYLKVSAPYAGQYDLIITNPPFKLAVEITRKALADVKLGGFVVMLQRLNWLGAQSRLPFWRENLPVSIYVHNKRLAFSNAKTTDSIEYAHFVFQSGNNPEFSKLKVL